MTATVCQAIGSRRLLAFVYDGHPRVVQPDCHGTGANGQEFLRGYQVDGTSSTGALGWKLFEVSHMVRPHPLEQRFTPRSDFRRDDVAMHPVHCCV